MGVLIPFRQPGECCASCRFFRQWPEDWATAPGDAPEGFCRHADRVRRRRLTATTVRSLGLQRSADDWCTRYGWAGRRTPGRKEVQLKLWPQLLSPKKLRSRKAGVKRQ